MKAICKEMCAFDDEVRFSKKVLFGYLFADSFIIANNITKTFFFVFCNDARMGLRDRVGVATPRKTNKI